MKKLLLFGIFCLMMTFGWAQIDADTTRQMVILEITTSTYCPYCPGAAMGAEDLLANGKYVAVIEHHNSWQGNDPYDTPASNARSTTLAPGGNPGAFFDVTLKLVGGNHTQSMYPQYLTRYNTRIVKPSPLYMTMDVTNNGLDYSATMTITKTGTISSTNLRLLFVVTQSHIPYNWQGQNHLSFVNRLMLPDQNGTVVDFSSGDTQVITINFTRDASWPAEDCEIVAFVEDMTNKVVLNGMKRAFVDLEVDFTANNTVLTGPGSTATFTPSTIGGYIDAKETYSWIFPGGTPVTDTTQNPEVTYDACGVYDVVLTVDRGGQKKTITKTAYITVGTVVNTSVSPDDTTCWYQPITLDATTPNATYLWEPGGATTPTFTVTYPEYNYGANNFSVTVSTPDGCETTKTFHTYFDVCTGIKENTSTVSASIVPNPNNGSFTLEMNSGENIITDLKILNTLGTTVYEEAGLKINGKTVKSVNLNLNSGLYFLVLQNGDKKVVQKLFIN